MAEIKHQTSYKASYNRNRLIAIVCVMGVNICFALINALHHHYPLGVGTVLFLTPPLLRELDLRSGRPLRKLGSFEWSCFIAGFIFLAVLPFFIF